MPCMAEHIYNPSTSDVGSRESPKFEVSLTYIASFPLKNKNKKTTKIFNFSVPNVVQIYQLALGAVH